MPNHSTGSLTIRINSPGISASAASERLRFTRPARFAHASLALLLAAAWTVPAALAQSPFAIEEAPRPDQQELQANRGAAALSTSLKKLHTWASIMLVTAHPDDEDGGMLTYESRATGARTALLTLTRGEGGQNAVSGDLYDALGILRTQELLNSDQYYGTEQYWTRVTDYGFSKTIDEAFQQWGHDRVLYDAVRAVRLNRPLVVASVFVGGITDGHGHHQVAGAMAQEVYNAAGDPSVFPDQIQQGLRPWKPLKVYARVPTFSLSAKGMFDYATGKWAPVRFYDYVNRKWMDGVPSTDLEIPEGTYDPRLGQTFFQTARQGLGQQKSQMGGPNLPLPGDVRIPYHRYASRVPAGDHEASYFDGIDTSLPGLASLAHGDAPFLKPALTRINQQVEEATRTYSPESPEKIAPLLHDGYLETQKLIEQVKASSLSEEDKASLGHELGIKLVQFTDALAESLGLQVSALVVTHVENAALPLQADETFQQATPGMEFDVRVHVSRDGGTDPVSPPVLPQDSTHDSLRLTKTWLSTPPEEPWKLTRKAGPGLDDPRSEAGDAVFHVAVPGTASLTRPFFSRLSTEQAYYDISKPEWVNRSFAPYPLSGWAEFDYNGVPIRLGAVVQTAHRMPGLGMTFAPLTIVPNLAVSLSQSAGVVPLSGKDFPVTLTLRNNAPAGASGQARLELPAGWSCTPQAQRFALHKPGEETTASFTVHPAALAPKTYSIQAVAEAGGIRYTETVRRVGYAGLAPYDLYRPATYRITAVDVKTAPDLRIGYVMGTGDEVPQAIEALGLHPHLLSATEILEGDLSGYDVIMLGIRAYSARPELAQATGRLLDYVHGGGRLVVQYQSGEFDHDYGPYPYVLSRSPEKVVDEKTPVVLLQPETPVFQAPNHITAEDFNGWVEERGHSFLASWDPHYEALTETHDPDQDAQRGGLLYTRYGRGEYIYAAYALYRQLPEGVPGAYRILANLLGTGRAR